MRLLRYIGQRLLLIIPQVLVLTFAAFVIIRLLPGDPVLYVLGPLAPREAIDALTHKLGLDKPIIVQFWIYLQGLVRGEWGISTFTQNPVLFDIVKRFPATLELITFSMLFAILIGVPLGMLVAIRPRSLPDRLVFSYGMIAGSIPEFWFGLLLIFLFYFVVHLFPAPMGRLDVGVSPPDPITGMYVIDSLLRGNLLALKSSISHLVLPVLTLGLIWGGIAMKMTRQTMVTILDSEYIAYARACGLPTLTVAWHAVRASLPPVVTLLGLVYSFGLSGAVLVERIIGWGGLGQYSVDVILTADYFGITGVVLVMSTFSLLIYLLIDLSYFAIDPRVKV
jgi:peptide/nickel transport system permease protein